MKNALTFLVIGILLSGQVLYADRVQVVPRTGGGSSGGSPRERESSQSSGSTRARGVTVERRSSRPSVMQNRSFERHVIRNNRVNVVPDRTYWRNYRGNRYAHRYHGGRHWYGFHNGPRFYWSQYHHNRWWRYDPIATHWTFWHSGYWWWGVPGGGYYVYVNDAYVPYAAAEISVPAPDYTEAPPEGAPPEVDPVSPVKSSDGRRMVQIVGDENEAYLYDTSAPQPVFLKALGKNATNARFSGGTDGKPLQILIDFEDGRFTLFSDSGDPVSK